MRNAVRAFLFASSCAVAGCGTHAGGLGALQGRSAAIERAIPSPRPPAEAANAASAASVPAGHIRWRRAYGGPVAYAAAGSVIVIANGNSIAAYDASDGRRRWQQSISAATLAASGNDLYAIEQPLQPSAFAPGGVAGRLSALDASSGAIRWQTRTQASGVAADARGAIGYATDLWAYDRSGRLIWHMPSYGGYSRLFFDGSYLLTTSDRSGSTLHGELESIVRASGHLIGRAVWFGKLVALDDDRTAYAESDFPFEMSELCCRATLMAVSVRNGYLNRPGDAVAPEPTLYETDLEYNPDLAENVLRFASGNDCLPRVSFENNGIHGGTVRLGNLFVFGAGDRLYHMAGQESFEPPIEDACAVGDPIGGFMLVARAHVLELLTRKGTHDAWFPLIRLERSDIVTSAATASSWFVQTTRDVYLVDRTSTRVVARWPLACDTLNAIDVTPRRAVLVCGHAFRDTPVIVSVQFPKSAVASTTRRPTPRIR
jgi:PQQ-like domain